MMSIDKTLRRQPSNHNMRSTSQTTPDGSPTSSTEQGSGQKKQDGATPVPPFLSGQEPDSTPAEEDRTQMNFRRKKCQRRKEKKRHGWTKEEQTTLMECYYKSNPNKRGYLKRLHIYWMERKMGEFNQQHLGDQVRSILKKKVFSEKELEELRKKEMYTTEGQPSNECCPHPKNKRNRSEEREAESHNDPTDQADIDRRLTAIIEEEEENEEPGVEQEERRGALTEPEERTCVEESVERIYEEETEQQRDDNQEMTTKKKMIQKHLQCHNI